MDIEEILNTLEFHQDKQGLFWKMHHWEEGKNGYVIEAVLFEGTCNSQGEKNKRVRAMLERFSKVFA